MAFLPNLTQLGSLSLVEVYEYYDKPLLVLACNELDHRFLGVLIEDNPGNEVWYFVELSIQRLNHIRTGFIDLFTAFAEPETGFVIQANVPNDIYQSADIVIKKIGEFELEVLPEKGEILSLETKTLPYMNEDIVQKARKAKRIYLRLRFEFTNELRTEAPAKYLGEVLCALQELLNAIGQSIKESATERGSIPRSIVVQNGMVVAGTGGGSFEVELASIQSVNLLDEADIAKSVEELSGLVEIGSDADRLREKLQELKIRVSGSYLRFLQSISKETKETHLSWAAPIEGKHGSTHMSALTAKAAATIIELGETQEPDEFTVMGTLVGANLRSKNYEITVSDSEKYSGRIPEEAIEIIRGAILGNLYMATMKKIKTFHPSTGKEEIHYELLNLTNVDTHLFDNKQE